jgi:hypothetical protein
MSSSQQLPTLTRTPLRARCANPKLCTSLRSAPSDRTPACFQVWIVGASCVVAALRPAQPDQGIIIALAPGAPSVHIINVHLQGQLVVQDAELTLTGCSIETPGTAESDPSSGGRRLGTSDKRVLDIVGGAVALSQTTISGKHMGAIGVHGGRLSIIECTIRDSQAAFGGALLVGEGSLVRILSSNLVANSASESGGALQVCSGHL